MSEKVSEVVWLCGGWVLWWVGYYVVASPAPPGFPLMRVNKVGDVVVAFVIAAWGGFGDLGWALVL